MTNIKRRAELSRVKKTHPDRHVPASVTMDTNFNKAKQMAMVALKASKVLIRSLTFGLSNVIHGLLGEDTIPVSKMWDDSSTNVSKKK